MYSLFNSELTLNEFSEPDEKRFIVIACVLRDLRRRFPKFTFDVIKASYDSINIKVIKVIGAGLQSYFYRISLKWDKVYNARIKSSSLSYEEFLRELRRVYYP